jgi:hypothetical protein
LISNWLAPFFLVACGEIYSSEASKVRFCRGADGQGEGHALPEQSHLGLVDVAVEDEVVHVSDGGDGGSVVEAVAHNHRVTLLDGDVEDESVDGGAYKRAAEGGTVLGDAFAYNLQGVLGGAVSSRAVLSVSWLFS